MSMAVSDDSGASKELIAQRLEFKQQLSERIERVEVLWRDYCQRQATESALADLFQLCHQLAGSASAFGVVAVTNWAREFGHGLKFLEAETNPSSSFSYSLQCQLDITLNQLKHAADRWQPSLMVEGMPGTAQRAGEFDLTLGGTLTSQNRPERCGVVYIVENDNFLDKSFTPLLESAHYRVMHFQQLEALAEACQDETPVIIITDIVFKSGLDAVIKLKETLKPRPSVVCISMCDDIDMRLAAARAGACRYFTVPVDDEIFIQTLDDLVGVMTPKSYRILLVDDDVTSLTYHASILRHVGMEVKTLSDPLQGLDTIAEFMPDIAIIDVYMPGCSGPELSKMIRQDVKWSTMPIIFISADSNLGFQLNSLSNYCDEFLVKPVSAAQLVASVCAGAERRYYTSRLHSELDTSTRENSYLLSAVNKHNLVSVTNKSGIITFANDKFCNVSGYSRKELVGQNHRILKSGQHPLPFYADLWSTISSGRVWHGTICNRAKDGSYYWVNSTITPYLDDQGKVYKYVSVRTDVTALQQSEERLNRGQQIANIATWDWNIKSGELLGTPMLKRLCGYSEDSGDISYGSFLAAVYPQDRELVVNATYRCLSQNSDYQIEHRLIWPDGRVQWVQVSGSVIQNETGTALHMLGVIQDINERKQAELALIAARDEANQANKAKSQFLSGVSHELRTPLNAIVGFSQLLKLEADQTDNHEQQESINEIIQASNHLLGLIDEVLDLAKVESGQVSITVEPVRLGDLIVEALQLVMPMAAKHGIDIHIVDGGSEVSWEQLMERQHSVRADPKRLKQVLLNLLSNAIKYNRQNGQLILSCTQTGRHSDRISIQDTGLGLTDEQQAQLFTSFNRLGAESRGIEGTGIGLMLSKRLIEHMGGSIGVDSRPNQGSTFWIELPHEHRDAIYLHERPVSEVLSPVMEAPLSDERKVIYIEDNRANLRLVKQLLSRHENISLLCAEDPITGLELADKHTAALILLDINLPGMNGFEVLNKLRQHQKYQTTPIFAVSANAMPKDIKKGLQAGFSDYITKPIDITSFIEKIKAALSVDKDSTQDVN